MSDERVRVLQMLEQGLITYEQSLALLSALGGQAPAPKDSGAEAKSASLEEKERVNKNEARNDRSHPNV